MKNCNDQILGYERAKVRMSSDGRADIFSKAKTNRTRVKNGLSRNVGPKPKGMQTQGSYAMRTMIQHPNGDYDVDDGVYFSRDALQGPNGGDKSAHDARVMICNAVQDERFKKSPEVRKNCVRIYYNDGYHVDVPVYRQYVITNSYTGIEEVKLEVAGPDWKPSDPLAVTKWFKAENERLSSDATSNGGDGQFVRVVRLIKAFARSRNHWSGKISNGFTISKLVADCFQEVSGRDDKALRSTMIAISNRLGWSDAVAHPVLSENISEAGNPKTRYFREKLDDKLAYLAVLDRNNCTHEEAMKAWGKLFKTDWFSVQPDPSDEDDADLKLTGPAVIKRGESRYA